MAANGINFVDEDDAGSILLALLKQIANAAGTYADKHFHEIRTRDGKEGNVCFAGDRACKQSFTRSRRSYQQDALRNSIISCSSSLASSVPATSLKVAFFCCAESKRARDLPKLRALLPPACI